MDKQAFLVSAGLQVRTLEIWIERQWLIPEDSQAGANFSDRDIARARLSRELTAELGVNDEGGDVILHLMDQLHGLRRALADAR
ncbi:chaperone modulator CbpM, partial [Dorea formicigenerans]|uniref:chaperone modulator CbpM n=1 Tax=Dorea formicigenerans TaxID=39486 RepID=UPI001EDD9F29